MAGTKSTGVSGGERRRKPRAAAGAALDAGAAVATGATPADGEWLGRLGALADRLAGLEDRGTIVDHVVSETMLLLPADEVRVRADAEAVTAPSFTEESEGAPARAVIPLVIGGRHFGAVEIAMKPRRIVGPGERALSLALARQCAQALDSLAWRKAQRERPVVDPAPAAEPPIADAPLVADAQLAAETPPVAPPIADASPVVPPASATPGAPDLTAAQATLVRLEGDLRALAKLARSAELPPTVWVDQAERNALRRLEEVRAHLLGVEHAA